MSEHDMNNYSLNCEFLNCTLQSGGNKEFVEDWEHYEPINLVRINGYLDFNLKAKHYENIVPFKRLPNAFSQSQHQMHCFTSEFSHC